MKFFNYSEAQQNFSTVLNTAVDDDDDVIITRSDGSKFKIVFIT
ncbi:MAG: type II toxin-antitoxin system prevent-host-death family antitoxin [Deltaproteobacteria bacterium]|jgi:prevent-host-death family protein|nr:type II toxin-antitoxin system prevent-host-death family antitoxin [Deltaproteobacteria bacterium]